jgi:hypothetical protein
LGSISMRLPTRTPFTGEAEGAKRSLDRIALRIEDLSLARDVDDGLHQRGL